MENSAENNVGHADSRERSLHNSLDELVANVRDFSRWWWQELLEMVPARWRHWAGTKLCVEASENELVVFRPPQHEPIDRIQRHGTAVQGRQTEGPMRGCDLVLDSSLVLTTVITLPDAAESNLRNVVAFSMDRYTPFGEDEVYFDVRVVRRDRSNGKLEMMLYVVPRATLQRISEQLAEVGLEAASVDVADTLQQPALRAGINLLPPADARTTQLRARLNSALAATMLVLLLTVMAIPLYQRHLAMHAMEQALKEMRLPVNEAERLREDVRQRSEILRVIMERRNAMPPAVDLLRELTRLTPDEAWAGQLEIKSGRLRITGEAAAGSELMQSLTATGYFSDPRFEAPLTQNPKSGRERFVLSLAIKERPDAP